MWIAPGFGKPANQRISQAQLATLQLNLIHPHSVGEALASRCTRRPRRALDF